MPSALNFRPMEDYFKRFMLDLFFPYLGLAAYIQELYTHPPPWRIGSETIEALQGYEIFYRVDNILKTCFLSLRPDQGKSNT